MRGFCLVNLYKRELEGKRKTVVGKRKKNQTMKDQEAKTNDYLQC